MGVRTEVLYTSFSEEPAPMFSKLFKSKPPKEPIVGYAKLNMRLQPVARGRMFEEPLIAAFAETGLGAVTGGGSKAEPADHGGVEVTWCAIDVRMADAERSAQLICDCLNRRGAAKGSQLEFYVNGERYVADFGVTEGIALYVTGTELSKEVHERHPFAELIKLVHERVHPESGGRGAVLETWHGPTESAIYVYGRSAEMMRAAIGPLLAEHPLCKGARVVEIA